MTLRIHTLEAIPLIVATSLSLLTGCGRPAGAQGGPPPDMQVLSVVAPVTIRPVGDVLDLVGDLQARDAVDLVSETDARLEEIGFEEGSAVTNGQLLFRFDDARLQAHLAQARASHRLAEVNHRRGEELSKSGTIPQQDFDQTEATFRSAEAMLTLARENAADARILAPFDGVITRRHVSAGQFLSRGQLLAALVRMDPLEVIFHVPERFTTRLAAGQKVEFHSTAGGDPREANIVYLAPRLDAATRTLEVKARTANPDGALRPGMFGRVRLTVNVNPVACVIPAAAQTLSAEGSRVVVMNAEGRAEFRPVTPGRRIDGMVEITAGLAAGERVVVEGHQKLGPGTRILISPKSAVYGIAPEAATNAMDRPR